MNNPGFRFAPSGLRTTLPAGYKLSLLVARARIRQHGAASAMGAHMTTAAEAALGGESAARSREAILAGAIGNALEWYDFAVYGYLVSTISKLFFPGTDPIASLLATYAVFGVGFVMRPVGSILFGIYGDRHGRRKALSAVIFLMAISTVAIGLLPTYDQVGVAAPILLVLARLVQGLSAGGEWGGSTAYIVEYAPEGRRGFIGSWQQFSVGSGFLLRHRAQLR